MRTFAIWILPGVLGCGALGGDPQADGDRAFEHLRRIVAMGPRLPGSEASAKAREYIRKELESCGLSVEIDRFTAQTPRGPKEMANILSVLPGPEKGAILLASHYDTKDIGDPPCPGANDGASSTALLLEIARQLRESAGNRMTVRFAFFDGEEAFERWSAEDSLYGSRHLVEKWKVEGLLSEVRAMVLLDLVGDKDLGIFREALSSEWLVEAFRAAAAELGVSRHFFRGTESIEDDHRPFLAAGVPAIDLIDFRFGPAHPNGVGAYWHTAEDNPEKCSAASLKIVGDVTLRALPRVESRVLASARR